MLHCSISDVKPGMVIAATVMHPERQGLELVSPGLELNAKLIQRLDSFGVERIWIGHDITADIAAQIQPNPSPARQLAIKKLQASFAENEAKTITSADIASFRQAMMDMVCELIASSQVAPLADRLAGAPGDLFAHCASVAYLSILVGLELETYVVSERPQLSNENARDLTPLGIGAMLHDIAKIAQADEVSRLNALDEPTVNAEDEDRPPMESQDDSNLWASYLEHPVLGYRMLEHARAPASARQVVLTHHQRWDGSGFPNMREITHGRQTKPQSGAKIHIFSRIVSAADTLERLLRNTEGQSQPHCAGLHAFASSRFDGWFDPMVRNAVLRCIPPFPVGSQVTLSDGSNAAVIAPNPNQPCLPTLRLLNHDDNSETAPVINLDEIPNLSIVRCAGEDVSKHLFTLPMSPPAA